MRVAVPDTVLLNAFAGTILTLSPALYSEAMIGIIWRAMSLGDFDQCRLIDDEENGIFGVELQLDGKWHRLLFNRTHEGDWCG